MLRRYYGKISFLPINEFVGHDGELVVDDITGKVYVMDGVTYGGTELVGAMPRYGTTPPDNPTPGALWYDPISGRTYIYFQDTWVDAAPNTTYTLPMASADVLGGIKVGNNLSIDEYGVLNAEDGNYILPTSNNTVLGGVKVDNVSIVINGSGVISANTASIQSNISILFSNAATQSSNIATLFSNAAVQSSNIATLFSNAATQSSNIATLFSNAATQSSNIATLFSNAATQSTSIINLRNDVDGLLSSSNAAIQAVEINNLWTNAATQATAINTINANVAAANLAISNKTVSNLTRNGHVFSLGNDGNVTLPASGTINYSNGTSILEGITAGGTSTEPSSTPPGTPVSGQLWYDTDSGRIYVYLDDSWVDASPPLVSSIYDNSNVAAYLPTDSTIIALRSNASVQANSINTMIANASAQQTEIRGLRANITAANAAIITANSSMKIYVDSVTTNWVSNASTQQTAINDIRANLGIQTSNSATQTTLINSLTANASAQQTEIRGLRANITAANAAIITANVGMQVYVDDRFTDFINGLGPSLGEFYSQVNSNLEIQTSNSATQTNLINTLFANAGAQQTEIRGLRANITAANAAIITANSAMKVYVDSVTTAWVANAVIQDSAINDIKANLALQIGNAATQTTLLNTLTANASAQETEVRDLRANITAANSAISTNTASISTINANVAAANSVISTKTVYSNTNAAAYLTTYSGSIGGSITVGSLLQAPQITKAANATGTVGQICWDSNYIYVCTATNTWKRAGLTGGY